MAMTNRHKNTVGRRPWIVVGGEPVEPTVHAHVPRITHPARIELEVVAASPAPENPTLFFILIDGMVALLVGVLGVNLAKRILRLVVGLDSHQVADWFRRVRLHPGVTHRKIKPAIGPPVQPMHAMAEVVETGENDPVFVGNIIAIGITQHRNLRRISNP